MNKRVAVALGILLIAVSAGLWVGNLSVPDSPILIADDPQDSINTFRVEETAFDEKLLWFYTSLQKHAFPEIVQQEITYALEADVRQFIIKINPDTDPLTWEKMDAVLKQLSEIPAARLMLDINLNPPAYWKNEHPNEIQTDPLTSESYPSITSSLWITYAQKKMQKVLNQLSGHPDQDIINGYVLSALKENQWIFPETPAIAIEELTPIFTSLLSPVHNYENDLQIYFPYRIFKNTLPIELLTEIGITGVITSSSPDQRGLGSTGLPMGLLHTFANSKLKWVYLDKTHTGFADQILENKDHSTSSNMDPLLNIFKRNMGHAVLNRIPIALSDLSGDGNMNQPKLWEKLSELSSRIEHTIKSTPTTETDNPGNLILVYDEAQWRATQHTSSSLDMTVISVLESVYRSGITFSILSLNQLQTADISPETILLFIGLDYQQVKTITDLHTLFTANNAIVLWVPATPTSQEVISPSHLSTLTNTSISPLEEPLPSSISASFSGTWFKEGGIVKSDIFSSSFYYINDTEVDTIFTFQEADKTAVSIKQIETGWTSITLAVPYITPALLRELADLMEIPSILSKPASAKQPLIISRPPYLLLHANSDTTYSLNFDGAYNIVDLYDPSAGWVNKTALPLNMAYGDTRLLKTTKVNSLLTTP